MNHDLLLARLESVEKQNHQIKLFGGLALGLLVTGLGFSFAAPVKAMVCDTVTAERFQLVDSRGNTRALLDSYGRDEAIFELHQKEGQGSITMRMGDDGAGLIAMNDSKGRVRTTMSLGTDGIPEFAFFSEKGEILRKSRGVKDEGDYLEKNSR